ncbi:MAG: hypothetical protein J5I92_14775 [Thiogranum sp.]|nr:hypothetical protein [Thiogranum sp.]
MRGDEATGIWAGWRHLYVPCEDLDDKGLQSQVIDQTVLSEQEKNTFEQIRAYAPQLLPLDAHSVELDNDTFQKLIAGLGDEVDADFRFIRLRRFLEVIDAGNRQGRFKIPVPHLPAPLPPAPRSPFQHHKFQEMVRLQPLVDAFIHSLVKPATELEPAEWWGRILLSALLYGGLLQTRWLLALPRALEKPDPELRWLDLSINDGSSGERTSTRRWLPDPLTRLLLIDGTRRGIPDFPLLNRIRSQQVMCLIVVYARCADFRMRLPRTLRDLIAASRTRMHLHLPPFLVQYAFGRHDSTSLPKEVWQRLISPPKTVASEEIRHGQRTRAPSGPDGAEDIDEAEGNEAWPAQLRALAIEVRQGDEGARERIQVWQQAHQADLLPSICRLAEWITERLLRKGRGRRVLRIRTVYAMLNSIGGRLVGQLGSNDPADLQDVEAYVELYQTALEDTVSLAVRHRVARSLKSFHAFLVERHGTPALEESGLFSGYGQVKGVIDANLIGVDVFLRALQWLHHASLERYGDDVAQVLCRIAGLGFFAGLRRSEAIGLKIADVEGSRHVDLLVRPNGRRKLKTRSAQRVIPLSSLMPPEELRQLLEWRDWRAQQYRENPGSSDDLFHLDTQGRAPRDTDPLLELITEALQRATHDPGFRFHHLRHSFANWQLMKFWHAEQKTRSSPLPEWLLYTEHEKARWSVAGKERKAMLGESPTNRRALMQISRLLGHSTVDITLTHYVHLLDLLMGRTLRRMTPRIGTRALAVLTGYSDSHVRRLRSDANPAKVQADDTAAIELDQFSNQLLAGGRHQNGRASRQPRITVHDQPVLGSPKTFLGRVQRVAEVLDALADKPDGIDRIAYRYGVSSANIRRRVERARQLPPGIMRQHGRASSDTDSEVCQRFDLPKGHRQRDVARRTAETLQRLMKQGDASSHHLRSVQKRLRETVNMFVRRWQDGTPLTVCIPSVPEAKKWIWLLAELGLESGVIIQHHPSCGKNARPEADQKAYWEKALGMRIEGKSLNPISADVASRGAVQIRVDPRRILSDRPGHRKVTVLTGVRLVLVMWLLVFDKQSG